MSFFKDRKIKKLGEAFGQHEQWPYKLTQLRLGELKYAQETGLSSYHKGKILTWNYEMASHAGRALGILRESEEIMGLEFSEQARSHRQLLIGYVDLPAFAVREWDTVGEPKIERLWQEFVVYEHTKNDEEQTILATLTGPTRVNSEKELDEPCQWCGVPGSTHVYSGSSSVPNAFSPPVKICTTCETAHNIFSEEYVQMKGEAAMGIGRAGVVRKAQETLGPKGLDVLAHLHVAKRSIDKARRLFKDGGEELYMPWVEQMLPKWQQDGYGSTLTREDFEMLLNRIQEADDT